MTLGKIRVAAARTRDNANSLKELLKTEGLPINAADDDEYWLLAGFWKILKEHRSYPTPSQQFIKMLVVKHLGRPITPMEMEDDVAEFLDRYDDVLAAAIVLFAEHPDSFEGDLTELG